MSFRLFSHPTASPQEPGNAHEEGLRALAEIESGQLRLAAVLDSLSEGVVVSDLEGKVLNMNPAALRLHGFTDIAEARRRLPEFASQFELRSQAGRILPLDEWPLARVLRGESFVDCEVEVLRRDNGEKSALAYNGTPVAGADGRLILAVLTMRDIRERKAAEFEIRRLNAELEERIRQRTAELERSNDELMHTNLELQHFAHATAHDLQTPLRAIAGFTQLLQKKVAGRGDAEVDAWTAQVVDNTRRLQTLIQALLSYASLDVQGLPFAEMDMEQLLDEVLGSLRGLIGHTGSEVIRQPMPAVRGDRTQIGHLLQNLIENGIKYNHSRPPRIAIASELQEDEWVFSVTDNGVGIDPRHHERIFEIFRRLHTYSQVPGSGIGLALCRRIVERHGGRIWVESRPGEGSTFYFSLPAQLQAGA